MKCAFCGCIYEQHQARTACQGCGLFGGCHLVKCPRCGYEQPQEPALIQWWRERWARRRSQKPLVEKG